jgi:hypothetical protein
MIDKGNLEEYFQALNTGNMDYIKQNSVDIVHDHNYFRSALVRASSANQFEVVKHLFDVFDEEKRKAQLIEDETHNKNKFSYYVYRFDFDNYSSTILEVCEKGYLDIFKLFINHLNGITNISRYETCMQHAFNGGQLEVIKYMLELPEDKYYIDNKKYYNSILDTSNPQGNHIIKYFLDNDELNKHVKQLKLLDYAYNRKNREIVEYIILEKDMLYSKKIKKAVEHMTYEIDIPDLFNKREVIKLARELEQELSGDKKSCKKIKI